MGTQDKFAPYRSIILSTDEKIRFRARLAALVVTAAVAVTVLFLLVIVPGVVIGFLVIAMYLPMLMLVGKMGGGR